PVLFPRALRATLWSHGRTASVWASFCRSALMPPEMKIEARSGRATRRRIMCPPCSKSGLGTHRLVATHSRPSSSASRSQWVRLGHREFPLHRAAQSGRRRLTVPAVPAVDGRAAPGSPSHEEIPAEEACANDCAPPVPPVTPEWSWSRKVRAITRDGATPPRTGGGITRRSTGTAHGVNLPHPLKCDTRYKRF